MTKTHQIELESFAVILIAAALGAGVGYAALHRSFPPQTKISLPIMQSKYSTNDTSTLVPSPTISLPKSQTTSQISPDGTKLLVMTETTNQDKTKTYTVSSSDIDGSNQQIIYTTKLFSQENMNIPFNTWSPDNRYIFINHTDNKGTRAIIMRADGQTLTSDSQTFDAKALFEARNTRNKYQEATGWASETLVIINTTTESGDKGLSSWLEVPSGAIIPLSIQF